MPRDLLAERDGIIDQMLQLEKADKSTFGQRPSDRPAPSSSSSTTRGSKDKIERDMDKQDAWAEIKPYTKSLTPSDVDACVKLEDATFPPQERATKEKVSSYCETLPCSTFAFTAAIACKSIFASI